MISVCIITKNEKVNIKKCLDCLYKAGTDLEIIIIDTGSTDGTREFLEAESDANPNLSVYDFEWCNDFAKAKNYAISKASNDTVLVVDSDEYLQGMTEAELHKLEQIIRSHSNQVGRVKRRNVMTRNGRSRTNEEWINRIFDRTKFHYVGKIHEQVEAIDGASYETFLTPIIMEHSGYDLSEEQLREKAKRNIVLLDEELIRLRKASASDHSYSEEKEAYILYQLGKGYYMSKDYAKAVTYFGEALAFDLNPKLEFVIDAVETYGYALINSGQADVALGLESVYDEFSNSADFVFMMGLVYMNNEMFEQAVVEFEKATHYKECKADGVNSYVAFYNIGVIFDCLGDWETAIEYYNKCGDYKAAQERIKSKR